MKNNNKPDNTHMTTPQQATKHQDNVYNLHMAPSTTMTTTSFSMITQMKSTSKHNQNNLIGDCDCDTTRMTL